MARSTGLGTSLHGSCLPRCFRLRTAALTQARGPRSAPSRPSSTSLRSKRVGRRARNERLRSREVSSSARRGPPSPGESSPERRRTRSPRASRRASPQERPRPGRIVARAQRHALSPGESSRERSVRCLADARVSQGAPRSAPAPGKILVLVSSLASPGADRSSSARAATSMGEARPTMPEERICREKGRTSAHSGHPSGKPALSRRLRARLNPCTAAGPGQQAHVLDGSAGWPRQKIQSGSHLPSTASVEQPARAASRMSQPPDPVVEASRSPARRGLTGG